MGQGGMKFASTEHIKTDWAGMRAYHFRRSMCPAVSPKMRRWHRQIAKDVSQIMKNLKLESWSWASFIAKFHDQNQQPAEADFYSLNERTNEERQCEVRGVWRSGEAPEAECQPGADAIVQQEEMPPRTETLTTKASSGTQTDAAGI